MESLKFSNEGPAFPGHLVNAMFAGDVVFLCGAGISAPQLPTFKALVDECFARLRLNMSASENQSYKDGRYEEVLGSASRRIVDPAELERTIMDLLGPQIDHDLSHHHTILKLSRNLNNQPLIITTNFDTLLEQALSEQEDPEQIISLSFAGQDLPPPGNANFGGIIHLHGRIENEELGLSATPLVMTSSDYGEAYMRAGWASRFLFDLCRCKTVVLAGYRAGDAPVRYFLNVLEADRQRFPDLHKVYALEAVTEDKKVDTRWEALAVEPIAYKYHIEPETKAENHSVLWRDLERLADVIERPSVTRQQWAREILGKPFAEADPLELDRIAWLYRGHRDLWWVAIKTIEDADWFDFLADRKLWSDEEAPRILAAWVALDFQSADRFQLAIEWLRKLGKPFAHEISRRLQQPQALPEFWVRAWRLLSISEPRPNNQSDEAMPSFMLVQVLQSAVVLNDDLERAVRLLRPVLELRPKLTSFYTEPDPETPERINQLAWPYLRLRDEVGAERLMNALIEFPQPQVIMSIATAQLASVARLSLDIGDISEDFDRSSSNVPSIEPHPQNAHRDGLIYLVQLLASKLPEAADADCLTTRNLVDVWPTMPGQLGTRLWLHALRNNKLFTANEAIEGLMALTLADFWTLRRELALVLRDRSADADADSLALIEHRILTEGQNYFDRYEIEAGQADWRVHALDTAVWLRLNMLAVAGRLSDAGAAELEEIKRRRDYLAREIDDQDFFDSYSSGVRLVKGDAQPIMDASDTDRIEIARKAMHSQDIEQQLGWRAYCQADPHGAYDTLTQEELDEPNALLWSGLIETLSTAKEESDQSRNQLVSSIFSALEPATNEFLALVINPLANLYGSAQRRPESTVIKWWPRLFDIAVNNDSTPFELGNDLIDEAINSPGGRLTIAALSDISEHKQSGEPINLELINAITQAASAEGRQGVMARAILVENAAFVDSLDEEQINKPLEMALRGDTSEAVALRSVMVVHGRLSRPAYRAFSKHILRGVTEVDSQGSAPTVAARIISPALSIVSGDSESADWGIMLTDVAEALRSGPPALRVGAAKFLNQWITYQFKGDPSTAWRSYIGPLLAKVWPRERMLRERELTPHFADLAVNSGEAFPEALNMLQPYLEISENQHVTHTISKTQIPENFPSETLALLWKLFGVGSTGDLYNAHQILDRLIEAQPNIEVDRRFQWLNQRTVRYE
ncbi:SIR2 family protein [Halomonas sp. TG39a]|uniref:SIR2 family protein n=1 Tax=Halomonas sp. TG39a TaxID=1415755 RepID=UPI0005543CE3|nr:SIR2 family protein [Halomonas sp. TG39a]